MVYTPLPVHLFVDSASGGKPTKKIKNRSQNFKDGRNGKVFILGHD